MKALLNQEEFGVKLMFRLMMVCVVVSQLFLSGCGGGSDDPAPKLITFVGWVYDNAPADLSSYSMGLSVRIYFTPLVLGSDIDSFIVTAADGTQWTVPVSTSYPSTTGQPYVTARLVSSRSTSVLPLAGSWSFALKLKNGTTSASYRLKFHEPGSSVDATHPYVYAKEDWTPSINPSQYVAALGRFPTFGYSLQYSSAGGGAITSTGLPAVRSAFFAAEPTAYNMYCWLYDANNTYLGYTKSELTTQDGAISGLVTPSGELSITSAFKTGSDEPVDLALVKSIRFVYVDGAQFGAGALHDYRSISYLVPVN